MIDAIILTAINLFWGFMWYHIGKYIGRKEAENDKENA